METLAEIFGASFAVATVALTIGGALIIIERYIFGDKRVKKAREEGIRLGVQQERELATRAYGDRREGESLEHAMERLRSELRG